MSLKLTDLQFRLPHNALNYGYDSIAGDDVAGGTSYPYYTSLVGFEVELDNATALALSYNVAGGATNQLYAGLYRYVQFLTTGSVTPTLGYAAFWGTTQTPANIFATDGSQYQVYLDGSASIGDGLFAGAVIVTDSAGAAGTTAATGRYGWLEASGITWCYFGAADTTVGDLVVITTGSNTFTSLADNAGTWTAGGQTNSLKNIVGVAVEAPAATSSGPKRVMLWPKNILY